MFSWISCCQTDIPYNDTRIIILHLFSKLKTSSEKVIIGLTFLLLISPLIDISLKKRRDSQVRDGNVSSIFQSISFVTSLFISCTHQFTFLTLISSSSISNSPLSYLHLFLPTVHLDLILWSIFSTCIIKCDFLYSSASRPRKYWSLPPSIIYYLYIPIMIFSTFIYNSSFISSTCVSLSRSPLLISIFLKKYTMLLKESTVRSWWWRSLSLCCHTFIFFLRSWLLCAICARSTIAM